MEKASQSTLSHSLFLAETVGLLFLDLVLIRVARLDKITQRLLPFLKFTPKILPWREHQLKVASDEVLLSREDVETIMGCMGMSYSREGEQLDIGLDMINNVFEEEPSLQEVKAAFSVFDDNSDGFIDAKDLKRVLSKLGFGELEVECCEQMIERHDRNRDGKIDFDEFVKFMETGFC